MTYRKLFLWLLAGSTLVLAGVVSATVWQSTRKFHLLQLSGFPQGFFMLSVSHGFIACQYEASFHASTEAMAEEMGLIEIIARPFRPADISAELVPYEASDDNDGFHFWNFHMERSESLKDPFNQYDYSRTYLVCVPVWVPWLLFNTGTFAFCRLMERRSAAGRVKKLVEDAVMDAQ